jgi:hypothetical protein
MSNSSSNDASNIKPNHGRDFLKGLTAFFICSRMQANPIEQSDLAYRERLLAIYEHLKVNGQLVTELPTWVPETFDVETLRKIPRLQAALADSTSYTPSKWLLEQELSRRQSDHPAAKSWYVSTGEDVYNAAAREKLSGLCFSGGGIRSATFCLGVLQALANNDQLKKFDYLSTVSGGGYIHQWLASWILNEPGRFSAVQQKLIPIPGTRSAARAPEQIAWLRRYSNYLTPQRGLLSADTWTMIATWFRNTFLNQIILFSFFAVCILLVRALASPFTRLGLQAVAHGSVGTLSSNPIVARILATIILVISALSISFACYLLWGALRSVNSKASNGRPPSNALDDAGVLTCILGPGFVYSLLVTLEGVSRMNLGPMVHWRIFLICFFLYIVGLLIAITFGVQSPQAFTDLDMRPKTTWYSIAMILSAVLCSAIALLPAIYISDAPGAESFSTHSIRGIAEKAASNILKALTPNSPKVQVQGKITLDGEPLVQLDLAGSKDKILNQWNTDRLADRLVAVFGPIVIFGLPFLAIRLQLGILGRFYSESRREWLARFGAWGALISIGWMSFVSIALIGPKIFGWFFDASTVKKSSSLLSLIAIHIITLYAGGSGKSDGKPKPGTLWGYAPMDLIGMIGAPICVISILIVVSGIVGSVLDEHGVPYQLMVFIIVSVVFLIFGSRVDVNEFSMHGFYRNRLARCYLGGTNPARTPDPFTHFDEHDTGTRTSIAVSDLLPARYGAPLNSDPLPYDGPFPIFCCTINLTFGEDLGWQERKGASFAFTPLYSGYHVGWTAETRPHPNTSFNGYVRTDQYAYRTKGIPLSTAAAISGAALSPNQGYSSNPAVAFLMTLFNVRLGWWLANPRKPKIWPSSQNSPTPRVGLFYLLRELFGSSTDTSNYVCLCDGGRFENMGLYELVRRRCSHIVVCDAEQDDPMVFQGIGGAIAKCRTDFGVKIDLDLKPLIPDRMSEISAIQFQTGTIEYPAPPGSAPTEMDRKIYKGTIVYLKSTMGADMPGDILHYKRAFSSFPQDSTLNQWFTESQFESYRLLGQLIADKAKASI